MKKFIWTVVVISLCAIGYGGAVVYKKIAKPVMYEAPKVQIETETVEVNRIDAQIEKRNKELDELYRKAQKLEASIDVREGEIKRLQDENIKDRKELASFIAAIGSKN